MAESKQIKPMKLSEIDIKKIVVHFTQKDIKATKTNPNKKLPYYTKISYKMDDGSIVPLVIQTGTFQTTGFGGIPRNGKGDDGELFYKTEKDRAKFQISYDDKQEACVELKEFAQSVDKFIKKNKENIFKDVSEDADPEDYVYNELYKELDKKKIKKMKETGNQMYPMLKTEFEAYAKDKTNKDILDYKTTIFVKNADTGKFDKISIASLADIEKHVSRGSEQKCVLVFDRVWASQSKLGSSHMFGIKVKCMQIYVLKKGSGTMIQDQFNDFLLDDGEVGEDKTNDKSLTKEDSPKEKDTKVSGKETKEKDDDKKEKKSEKKTKIISGKKETSKKSSEESDDDDSDDEDSKKKSKPTKPNKSDKKSDKKKVSEKLSDISEDSSDDEKDEKTSKKKKSEESDDESDSESD